MSNQYNTCPDCSEEPCICGVPAGAAVSDTPETDEFCRNLNDNGSWERWQKTASFAATMERERDHWREKYENLSATGIHSCGAHCQRPLCVARRERDEARAEAERWRDTWCKDEWPSVIPKPKLPWEQP